MGVTNPDKVISNTPGVVEQEVSVPAWQDDAFFRQASDALADKGFVLTTVDDLIKVLNAKVVSLTGEASTEMSDSTESDHAESDNAE